MKRTSGAYLIPCNTQTHVHICTHGLHTNQVWARTRKGPGDKTGAGAASVIPWNLTVQLIYSLLPCNSLQSQRDER